MLLHLRLVVFLFCPRGVFILFYLLYPGCITLFILFLSSSSRILLIFVHILSPLSSPRMLILFCPFYLPYLGCSSSSPPPLIYFIKDFPTFIFFFQDISPHHLHHLSFLSKIFQHLSSSSRIFKLLSSLSRMALLIISTF